MTSNREQLEWTLRVFERRYDRLVSLRFTQRETLNEVGLRLVDAALHATAVDIADMKAAIASEVRR